jgi:chitinase
MLKRCLMALVVASLMLAGVAQAVMLTWDPVTTDTNGTPLIDPAAYDMHYGQSPGTYDASLDCGTSTSIDISGLTPGQTYYFAATARSGGAVSGFSNEVSDTIPGADTIAPTVSITSPGDGATVKRKSTVNIQASASDNVGVTAVEIYVNGSRLCTNAVSPYTCAWKVPNTPGRTYQLQAKAYDAAGNVGSSSVVTVRSQ